MATHPSRGGREMETHCMSCSHDRGTRHCYWQEFARQRKFRRVDRMDRRPWRDAEREMLRSTCTLGAWRRNAYSASENCSSQPCSCRDASTVVWRSDFLGKGGCFGVGLPCRFTTEEHSVSVSMQSREGTVADTEFPSTPPPPPHIPLLMPWSHSTGPRRSQEPC